MLVRIIGVLLVSGLFFAAQLSPATAASSKPSKTSCKGKAAKKHKRCKPRKRPPRRTPSPNTGTTSNPQGSQQTNVPPECIYGHNNWHFARLPKDADERWLDARTTLWKWVKSPYWQLPVQDGGPPSVTLDQTDPFPIVTVRNMPGLTYVPEEEGYCARHQMMYKVWLTEHKDVGVFCWMVSASDATITSAGGFSTYWRILLEPRTFGSGPLCAGTYRADITDASTGEAIGSVSWTWDNVVDTGSVLPRPNVIQPGSAPAA